MLPHLAASPLAPPAAAALCRVYKGYSGKSQLRLRIKSSTLANLLNGSVPMAFFLTPVWQVKGIILLTSATCCASGCTPGHCVRDALAQVGRQLLSLKPIFDFQNSDSDDNDWDHLPADKVVLKISTVGVKQPLHVHTLLRFRLRARVTASAMRSPSSGSSGRSRPAGSATSCCAAASCLSAAQWTCAMDIHVRQLPFWLVDKLEEL
jgi:hypothetical protein